MGLVIGGSPGWVGDRVVTDLYHVTFVEVPPDELHRASQRRLLLLARPIHQAAVLNDRINGRTDTKLVEVDGRHQRLATPLAPSQR
jgi:hypothetical protein